jgi:hypothetical protein
LLSPTVRPGEPAIEVITPSGDAPLKSARTRSGRFPSSTSSRCTVDGHGVWLIISSSYAMWMLPSAPGTGCGVRSAEAVDRWVIGQVTAYVYYAGDGHPRYVEYWPDGMHRR